MFNDKQVELSQMLFDKLKGLFPEIKLSGITEGAENPDNVWVNIVMPGDVDREIEMRELASDISTDILLDYGYHVSIISAENSGESA